MKAPPSKRMHRRDSDPVEQEGSVGWDMDVVLVPFKVHWRRNTNAEIERIEYGRRVSMEIAKKADQKRFLEAVLKFEWLSPQLRRAVMGELGRSVREKDKEINRVAVITLRHLLEGCKAEMRERKERPRGGIHMAAMERVAAAQGMTVEALKKRLERYPPTPELRRHLKEMARR